MSQVQSGTDALDALNRTDEVANDQEFASFKSGTTFTVKALGVADLITFYSYGIYKQVNSFVAKNPSKKSANGFPVENLNCWDLAWKYHADLSEKFQDEHSQESYKYRAKQRFALGFIDLTTGDPLIVDVSKNQAQAIHSNLKKYEARLGQFAFELSKQGQGTSTTVSLSLIPVLEDLTDAQRKHFEDAPEKFDMTLFDGLLYEADEEEQLENLVQSGFDVSLIGLDATPKKDDGLAIDGVFADDGKPIDIDDTDLPF